MYTIYYILYIVYLLLAHLVYSCAVFRLRGSKLWPRNYVEVTFLIYSFEAKSKNFKWSIVRLLEINDARKCAESSQYRNVLKERKLPFITFHYVSLHAVILILYLITFYSHQLMHFFTQLCISLLSYIKIT